MTLSNHETGMRYTIVIAHIQGWEVIDQADGGKETLVMLTTHDAPLSMSGDFRANLEDAFQ